MPRKSNVSQVSTTGEEGTPAKEKEGVSIEDLSLPRSMVQRLAKGVLPPNTQIQKDAITAISKGATVFVNHIADKANEITLSTNRKTISPNAVLEALAECEFSDFLPRVEAELKRFNEIATGKRNEYRRKVKEKEMGGNDAANVEKKDGEVRNGDMDVEEEDEGEARASKRVRREEGIETGEKHEAQQQRSVPNGTVVGEEGHTGDELAMEDEADQQEDELAEEDDEEDGQDEGSEEEEDEDGDAGSASGPDMESRLRAIRDGLSSGVDEEGSEDESD
ncbi:MAG: hypothetical protein Q9216_002223 [Gyalolechia sp. 2 TL-2023]